MLKFPVIFIGLKPDRDSETQMSETTPTGPDFSRGDGLLPAIAQDAASGEVLMLAYMNAESYRRDPGHRPGGLLQPQPTKTVAQR